jgi:hypothetical protein
MQLTELNCALKFRAVAALTALDLNNLGHEFPATSVEPVSDRLALLIAAEDGSFTHVNRGQCFFGSTATVKSHAGATVS